MPHPFHFAFYVKDLDSTRRFYVGLLGWKQGRSTDPWVDFDFFGSQLSAHATEEVLQPRWTGQVDGITVPMPHFGCIIPWDEFQQLAARLERAGVGFIISPRTRYGGQPGEQSTRFLQDESGNAIEMKAFRHPEHVFTA